ELVQATPEPDREAGRVCGSQSGRLRYLRADDGYAKDVRLELHERVVGDHAAVDLQLGEVDTRVGVDSIEDIARLERDGLERCSRDVALVGEPGQADHRSSCVGPPVRGEQSGERRDDVDAAVV